jgi:ABC-2 type transport system ATP-binding protein
VTPVLEARGLTKTYVSRFPRRDFTALDDVTFEVQRGEILAFLGPNGAGKTTAINLLVGFVKPTRGEPRLFGGDPADPRSRSRLGYLPENYAFYASFTAPVLLHYFGQLGGVPRIERVQRIDALLGRVGLADARDRPIGKYSRGMRQRLGIAQALLNNPELLILDEPTSGFDPLGRLMVRDLLVDLKRAGASILLSSHILSEVEAICDRVVILNRGRVVREGILGDVLGRGAGFEVVFRDANGKESMIVLESEGDAQRVLDDVRRAGGVVVRYRPVGRSLEEVFLEGVGSNEGGNA